MGMEINCMETIASVHNFLMLQNFKTFCASPSVVYNGSNLSNCAGFAPDLRRICAGFAPDLAGYPNPSSNPNSHEFDSQVER